MRHCSPWPAKVPTGAVPPPSRCAARSADLRPPHAPNHLTARAQLVARTGLWRRNPLGRLKQLKGPDPVVRIVEPLARQIVGPGRIILCRALGLCLAGLEGRSSNGCAGLGLGYRVRSSMLSRGLSVSKYGRAARRTCRGRRPTGGCGTPRPGHPAQRPWSRPAVSLVAVWTPRLPRLAAGAAPPYRAGVDLAGGDLLPGCRQRSARPPTCARPVPGIEPAEWTPRELRHSFVSVLSDAGISVEQIAQLVGHSGTTVTELVYRHQLRPVIQTGATVMDRLFAP